MSAEKEIYERLARIEADLHSHISLDDQRATKLNSIDSKLDTLNQELARYRGTVGGVVLVVSALIAFFKFFWQDIKGMLLG